MKGNQVMEGREACLFSHYNILVIWQDVNHEVSAAIFSSRRKIYIDLWTHSCTMLVNQTSL